MNFSWHWQRLVLGVVSMVFMGGVLLEGSVASAASPKVKLEAEMSIPNVGEAEVKWRSQTNEDGTVKKKLTCEVELTEESGAIFGDFYGCSVEIDGLLTFVGLLEFEIEDGDELEGKLVLRTTPGVIVPFDLTAGKFVQIKSITGVPITFEGNLEID